MHRRSRGECGGSSVNAVRRERHHQQHVADREAVPPDVDLGAILAKRQPLRRGIQPRTLGEFHCRRCSDPLHEVVAQNRVPVHDEIDNHDTRAGTEAVHVLRDERLLASLRSILVAGTHELDDTYDLPAFLVAVRADFHDVGNPYRQVWSVSMLSRIGTRHHRVEADDPERIGITVTAWADDVAEVSLRVTESVGPNTERSKGTLNPRGSSRPRVCARPSLPGDR
ncbi:MAG: hypothetical protein C0467_21960 [Planctomycetaceae bacterium]|nr:hypothetical protein [Planctomycetaceae bacterium]